MIPKIIHQTWKGRPDTLPAHWVKSYETWKSLAKEYGFIYMYWDDREIDQFISTYFPWFIEKFRSYPYGIQRADAFRYFVLYHYGGIYSDFDNVPDPSFFTTWFPKHQHLHVILGKCKVGSDIGNQDLTNAFMLSRPQHEFWVTVWSLLFEPFKHNPWKAIGHNIYYFQVLFSTGPGIISDAFHARPSQVTISNDLQTPNGPYISTIEGNSWHANSTSSSVMTILNQIRNKFYRPLFCSHSATFRIVCCANTMFSKMALPCPESTSRTP
jgi:mannosyltransferase OCH1-like enzyme